MGEITFGHSSIVLICLSKMLYSLLICFSTQSRCPTVLCNTGIPNQRFFLIFLTSLELLFCYWGTIYICYFFVIQQLCCACVWLLLFVRNLSLFTLLHLACNTVSQKSLLYLICLAIHKQKYFVPFKLIFFFLSNVQTKIRKKWQHYSLTTLSVKF